MFENDGVTPINGKVDLAERKRMHHLAGDQILGEVLSMLAFVELAGQHRDGDDFTMHGPTLADMAENIVRRVIDARKHYRESL